MSKFDDLLSEVTDEINDLPAEQYYSTYWMQLMAKREGILAAGETFGIDQGEALLSQDHRSMDKYGVYSDMCGGVLLRDDDGEPKKGSLSEDVS